MPSPLLPGEARAPRAPRLSPSPVLPGELSWPVLSFSSLEEAEAFALMLEKNLRLLEERSSPFSLRADANALEEEASSFLSSLRREPRLASSASSIRSAVSQLRQRALELRMIADRREALQAQLEESLEELEELMAELRWPLLAR
jgi:hypothetical protein